MHFGGTVMNLYFLLEYFRSLRYTSFKQKQAIIRPYTISYIDNCQTVKGHLR